MRSMRDLMATKAMMAHTNDVADIMMSMVPIDMFTAIGTVMTLRMKMAMASSMGTT